MTELGIDCGGIIKAKKQEEASDASSDLKKRSNYNGYHRANRNNVDEENASCFRGSVRKKKKESMTLSNPNWL